MGHGGLGRRRQVLELFGSAFYFIYFSVLLTHWYFWPPAIMPTEHPLKLLYKLREGLHKLRSAT